MSITRSTCALKDDFGKQTRLFAPAVFGHPKWRFQVDKIRCQEIYFSDGYEESSRTGFKGSETSAQFPF
jgi:hypothetical protein